jgi:aminoglycoside phosphotransferase (APT) family kinase protein
MSINQLDIADPLLQYIHQAFDDTSLQYHTPPTPLTGGFSSSLFKFQLNATGLLAQPLVIRVYPSISFPPGQAFREGEIQNLLLSEGYPTAPTLSICEDVTVLGHEFIIMQFMPGEMMINAYPIDQAALELAKAHCRLHTLDMNSITHKLKRKGFYTRKHLSSFASSFTKFLEYIKSLITTRQLTHLIPAWDWIDQHRSIVGTNLVVAHCDFHPMNILIDQGQISAVLDWQGFRLGEPEFDVMNTMMKLQCLASVLAPQYNWPALLKRYVAAYQQILHLTADKLPYYQAVWCLYFYIQIIGGLPRVNRPQIRQNLLGHLKAITGIELRDRG